MPARAFTLRPRGVNGLERTIEIHTPLFNMATEEHKIEDEHLEQPEEAGDDEVKTVLFGLKLLAGILSAGSRPLPSFDSHIRNYDIRSNPSILVHNRRKLRR